MLNPPTTLSFDSATETAEYLALLRFKRVPAKGLVRRWVSHQHTDDGTPIVVFASNTVAAGDSLHLHELAKR